MTGFFSIFKLGLQRLLKIINMYYFLNRIKKTLDSKDQNILNQMLLDLRKEKWGFVNRILGCHSLKSFSCLNENRTSENCNQGVNYFPEKERRPEVRHFE